MSRAIRVYVSTVFSTSKVFKMDASTDKVAISVGIRATMKFVGKRPFLTCVAKSVAAF